MQFILRQFAFVTGLAVGLVIPAGAEVSTPEKMAEAYLEEQAGVLACDDRHFIYGVGYIDGSYMERLFYVEHDGIPVAITAEFRDRNRWPEHAGQHLPPMPFTLELKVPRALYAIPSGRGWTIPEQNWGEALRFKYTSWYGEIAYQGGQWQIAWKGYRRPMLPPGVRNNAARVCAWFADPESHDILTD